MPDSWDDEQLLAVLKEVLENQRDMPPEFAEIGKDAYAWHNADAELAELTYDSRSDPDTAPRNRPGTAPVHALTFTAAQLAIEVEVTEDSLGGQLVPAGKATIEVQAFTGPIGSTAADEAGRFTIRPVPPALFRLSCRTASGVNVVTAWITP